MQTTSLQDLSKMPHILVVDDDDRIRQLVSRYLSDHGFVVCTADNAGGAYEMLAVFSFDALVVDVMMPGDSGLDLTSTLRAQNNHVPILLLTALGEAQDRIAGLETGADDYLPKPFEPQELVLRLQSLLRRYTAPAEPTMSRSHFKIGQWIYDPDHSELKSGMQRNKLTAVESNLLEALASRPGTVVSRDDLAAMCNMDAGERTIDVQVTRLRRKIEEDTKNPRYLQTVRGKGYLLRTESI